MATLAERSDNWNARGLIRRDFRHSHDGPEELPHRKKGKGKKYCVRNKGEHVYEMWQEWKTYGSYRYRYRICKCGKQEWRNSQSQRKYTRKTFGGDEITYWA